MNLPALSTLATTDSADVSHCCSFADCAAAPLTVSVGVEAVPFLNIEPSDLSTLNTDVDSWTTQNPLFVFMYIALSASAYAPADPFSPNT